MKTIHSKSIALVFFCLLIFQFSCKNDDDKDHDPPSDVEILVTEITNITVIEHFAGNAMVQYNGRLWLAGGDVQFDQDANFMVYNSSNGSTWNEVLNDAPTTRRYKPSLTVFGNAMWLIGGLDGSLNLHEDIWTSSNGENWTSVLSHAPFGGTAFQHCFVHNNKLILVTGYQGLPGPSHNSVWSTVDGINWTQENASAFPYRYGSSFVFFQNEFYVVGGTTNGTNFSNEIWKSSDGVNWSQVATSGSIFSGRALHTTTVHNGKVWLIGGENSSTPYADLWYSSDMIHWTEHTDLPSAAQAIKLHSALDYNGKIWVFGGEYFDAAESAWKLQGKIQTLEEL